MIMLAIPEFHNLTESSWASSLLHSWSRRRLVRLERRVLLVLKKKELTINMIMDTDMGTMRIHMTLDTHMKTMDIHMVEVVAIHTRIHMIMTMLLLQPKQVQVMLVPPCKWMVHMMTLKRICLIFGTTTMLAVKMLFVNWMKRIRTHASGRIRRPFRRN